MEKLCALRVKMNGLTQGTQRLLNPCTTDGLIVQKGFQLLIRINW